MPSNYTKEIEELLENTGRWGHISCAIEGDPADGFGYCSCGLRDEVIKPLTRLLEKAQKEAVGASKKPQSGNKPAIKQVDNLISEGVCQPCGKPYPVWFAPNELWNKVMRHPDGREANEKYAFICMDCFALEAEKVGVIPTAWILTTEKEAEASKSAYPEGNFVDASTSIHQEAVSDLVAEGIEPPPMPSNPPNKLNTGASENAQSKEE